jgi:acetyl-CoA/propionyl-CoA carboxylase biotin carboxyl carrier protein
MPRIRRRQILHLWLDHEARRTDGFGVRFDAGYESGDEISQFTTALIGKLIVWGATRGVHRTHDQGARRPVVEAWQPFPPTWRSYGIPTSSPSNTPQMGQQNLDLPALIGAVATSAEAETESLVERSTTVEVNGKRFLVKMWVPDAMTIAAPSKARHRSAASGSGAGSGDVTVPMQGTIVKILVDVGETVEVGQGVVVLEAMKMENQINADKPGTVTEIKVAVGDKVGGGDVVAVIA